MKGVFFFSLSECVENYRFCLVRACHKHETHSGSDEPYFSVESKRNM